MNDAAAPGYGTSMHWPYCRDGNCTGCLPPKPPLVFDCGHTCCDERSDPFHDHFLAADNCPSCVNGTP